ncbi:MAG: hypothetical protein GWP12_03870 [Nitrospirae bacterium]|nr:hypothetical protein [Nitrospirota bacterium]
MITISTLRYGEHKTYNEIIDSLAKKGIKISKGEVFNLCQTFESLIKGWHDERVAEIRAKLKEYVLSIDGTYSYKDKTLYIFRDYTSGLVLYAALSRDDKESVRLSFERVIELYGKPIAVITDMQSAFIELVKQLLPGVPHQYCQYHFLKNTGEFMEDDYRELGKRMKQKGASSKLERIENEIVKSVEEKGDCEVQDEEKGDECVREENNLHDHGHERNTLMQLMIIQLLCVALKVRSDLFPFELYYVKVYDRYKAVRAVIRKCIKEYLADDWYKQALCNLERILASVINDEVIKNRVKRLKYDYGVFSRLRTILRNEDKQPKEGVERRMKRFLAFIESKAKSDSRYKSLADQIKRYWCGLFHTYEDARIPRTNNDMEGLIKEQRRKWRRMTGNTNVDEWIVYHLPTGIYLFNLIGASPPLEKLGFSTDLFEILSSVRYETYKNCVNEYEERRNKDRIRKRANRNIDDLLKSVLEKNKIVISVG